jgi:PAS domain S-box-containing protein
LALGVAVWLIFGLEGSEQLRFFYPLFVPVIWIALRWGAGGALLGILAVQVGLLVAVQDNQPVVPLLDLQFLMLTLALTALMLGAVAAERADALARVAAGEAEVRALLATAPDAVLTTDSSGSLRSANLAARRLFGIDDDAPSMRMPLEQLLPELVLSSRDGRQSVAARRRDGNAFPADVAWVQLEAPAPSGWLAIVRDATDRRRAEAETRDRDTLFARAMRFAVAGELASALAHELNQPITAVTSYLRAAQILVSQGSGPSADSRLGETLVKATGEARRAAGILRRLRDFYLGGAGRPVPVSLAAMAATVADSLDTRLRAIGATLEIAVDAAMPTLLVDATRLEIVLQNLLTNAIEAVAERGPEARHIQLRGSVEGGMVQIEVEDSGPGVAPESLSMLFEPLNTSKPEGMGLGLAISRSLLRAQSGELSYQRGERLGGALFLVQLPLAAQAVA